MKSSVVQQLNQLNNEFYAITADSFDSTRQQPWQGWLGLSSLFKRALSIPGALCADIGCGNGRFLVYLIKEIENVNWKYVGLDNSVELLTKAQTATKDFPIEKTFQFFDLISELQNDKPLPISGRPELITVFGLLHHVPSFELRLKLFDNLRKISSESTKLVTTTWQFIEDENLMKRKVHPEQLNITSEELEEYDYILNWERDVTAHRYCHYTSDDELETLAKESGWGIDQIFSADGKSNTLNHYFVLSPR